MDIDTCYRLTVESRIRELWGYRQWYRANHWAQWNDLRKETEVELRCLVGVARRARAMAAAVERAERGWSEPELREAWGR